MPGVITLSRSTFADRYVIHSEAGAGGMATIYRARDLRGGKDVALKILRDAAHGTHSDRFSQEAALLAELAHPAIVRYIDHGISPAGELYIAMEWLDGETLEQRLARGPLGVLDAVDLGRRVLEALAAAHRYGIVHRDIKPSNLFLPNCDLAQVKLIDFGIARRMFDPRRLTATGSTVGTPLYMSPEQARGAAPLDARSDVFSMGSVLYECLTGQPPFAGETPLAILAKICMDEPTAIQTIRTDVPSPLAALLGRMLTKIRDQRPSDATDLAAQLSAIAHALSWLGLGNKDVAEPGSRLAPIGPRFAVGEQRVLSVIVLSRNATSTGTRRSSGSLAIYDGDAFDEVEKILQPFGARAERFPDGSMVVTIIGEGTTTDSASRAARCTLELKVLFRGAVFAISTGRAPADDRLPLGEVVDDACRILKGEKPGTIRIDDVTASLLESRFEITGGAGKRRLLFEKGMKEAPRTVLGKEVPCVGRERELLTLEALFAESTSEPVARVVLMTAPAGAGKSRLRHELLDRIQSRGKPFEYLIGRGDPMRAGAPFALIGPALRVAAGISGAEPLDIQRKRLVSHTTRSLPPEVHRRVSAFLGEVTGIPFPDDDFPPLRAARQNPRLMADQTLAAWLDWLEAECAQRPVLLVLEDLHWGDVPSVQLVDAALRTLRERPFMVLAIGRPEVEVRFPGLWAERDLQHMAVPPLTAKACQKLLKHVLGDIEPDHAVLLVERADGNPFFLEELARAVAAGADLRRGDAVPDTILGVVQARLDALGPDAKRILRTASIFGQTFRGSGVRALIGKDDGGLDAWIDILAKREVIFARAAGDTRELVFRHALLREAAYKMLMPEDCILGHRLAGEWLEQAGEHNAIVLVEHFERGKDLPRAAHWCRQAAQQSLDANDLAAVLERVERGVRLGAEGEILGGLRIIEAQTRFWRGEYVDAESAARAALGNGRAELYLQAVAELIAALGQQARYSEIETWLQRVRRFKTTPQVRIPWCDSLLRAAEYLHHGGRYELANEAMKAAEAHVTALDACLVARMGEQIATMAHNRGDHAAFLKGFDQALRARKSIGDDRNAAVALVNKGVALQELGLLEDAENHLRSALEASRRMDLRVVTTGALANLGLILAYQNRLSLAEGAVAEALEHAERQHDVRAQACAEIFLSLITLLKGDACSAESYAAKAVRDSQGVPPLKAPALARLACALLAQKKSEAALTHAETAYHLLEQLGQVESGEDEALIRLTYAAALTASDKAQRAWTVLRNALTNLETRANTIRNPQWRESFLTRIPQHAEIIRLANARN